MVAELALAKRIVFMLSDEECVHAEVWQLVTVLRKEARVGNGAGSVDGDNRLLWLRCDNDSA